MADDTLSLDDIRKMAADIGLTRLTEEHLRQLLVSTRQARSRRDVLPVAGLVPADEPSHVFRLDPKEGR
jgi:hypothetical protein